MLKTPRQAAIKAIKEKYGDVSAGIVYNINKTATEYFYKDANGQRVSLYGAGNNKPGGINSPGCLYDCSTASQASDLTIVYNLDYAERFYGCESDSTQPVYKSTVFVKWTVSVPFSISTFSVGNQFSNGYLKFTPPSPGSPTIYSVPYTDMTITYISAAPGCSTNSLYEVTYKVIDVPDANFANGTTLDAAVDLANNCRLVYNLVSSGYVSAPPFSQDGYMPCNRIDKVYVNPNTGPSNCTTASGNYLICSPPFFLTPIDYHQFEYREVTSGSSLLWANQTGTIYYGQPTTTGVDDQKISPTGTSNLIHMLPSSGDWLVRYRNVNTIDCDVINGTNWGNPALWVTEVWTP